jgi:Family of unknown function (DUF5670)
VESSAKSDQWDRARDDFMKTFDSLRLVQAQAREPDRKATARAIDARSRTNRVRSGIQGSVLPRSSPMLLALFVLFLLLWGFGMLTAYTAGGLIHVLLIVALIAIVFHFLRGRRTA